MKKLPNLTVYCRVVRVPLVIVLSFSFFATFFLIAIDAEACRSKYFKRKFVVEVVSSAPEQITGGDARLHIDVPKTIPFGRVAVLVNGADQSDRFDPISGTRTLTGVIDGLIPGENTVRVKVNGRRGRWWRPRSVKLKLTNYPITGPVFSGPQQYPFVCTVQDQGLGQPIIDNDSEGYPVFAMDGDGYQTDEVIGFSRDCSAETLVEYIYMSTGGGFKSYTPGGDRPADMAQTSTTDGLTVDYVVRWERGTINRFIYSIAMLAPDDTGPEDLNRFAWNGKLIYYFQGGVAIGHDQGDPSSSRMRYDDGLSRGYAVAYSTGTKSGTHYNLVLGGETALMVKERFVELYDEPIYTVGLGGSGGAIQQYVYAQNHEGLFNAAIPQYSYPDMVTQTVHVGDCELLEFYMDIIDGTNPRWQTWSNRTLIEGLNASDTVFNKYTQDFGNSECIQGWRGLSPLAMNPRYGYVYGQELIQPPEAVAEIEWTHFGDLVNFYGTADDGYARRLWDNVGVQYGLAAVAAGEITPAEFLQLNAVIGGWNESADMVQEGSPFYPPDVIDFTNWDPWSSRNHIDRINQTPVSRTAGDLDAMQAAYEAGLVFMGDIGIPIIDWRHYLEEFLDMHNSHQSFAARQRIRDARGNSDNQVIWFTDAGPSGPVFDQTPEALEVMDEWLENIRDNPDAGVAGNKPARAVDRCFHFDGSEIDAGAEVWNGILDDSPPGICTAEFPIYSTSRIVAGGPFKGSIFKCRLMPVAEAVATGLYGVWNPNVFELLQLEQIFPDGVCDFSQPDAGLPAGW
ncbi:hypothetical protein D1BOALGB6SA_9534 [Olavius sp. associated proteobacterium Delta 1]|nr:hypothetical protein D1BOALGB6SA_9534 [Olavius sp. associated proteobacterium Delta 1]